LRKQSLSWLSADLAAWRQALDRQPDKARAVVRRTLLHWQDDSDLAGVRGDGIDKLPEAERPAWRQMWKDLGKTLEKTGDNKKSAPSK
jgi:hypothetical protein